MVSNIVLKIVQQSVNSDLFLMQLHDNNIMGLLCKLFRESIRQSHDDPNVCFANKQVLVNVFESLHLLSVGTSKKLPRTRKTNLNIFHMVSY